jgi:pimeloyl-ACP methyl ester carboxylesterase
MFPPAHILLIHGALADGSSWSQVIPHLQSAGHNVTAVQQPLTSLPNDIATVRSAISTITATFPSVPIVAVGHSFGGFVLSNAATSIPEIKSLVYVMAFAPDVNETVAELGAPYGMLPSASRFAPTSDGRLTLPEDAFLQYFAPDVEPTQAKVLSAVQGPFDAGRFMFASGEPAWTADYSQSDCAADGGNGKYYIVATEDQIIAPDLERFFAKRMGAKTFELEGASHAGLWSQGEKVAEVILEAARGVAGGSGWGDC